MIAKLFKRTLLPLFSQKIKHSNLMNARILNLPVRTFVND